MTLVETARQTTDSPVHLAMLFWPEFGGALATAVLFGRLFRTRWVPVLAFGGAVAVAGGAVVLTGVAQGPDSLVAIGSGLVGVGVGASVSPALFTTGFSLRSTEIQRVFALVELLRAAAAFVAPPLLLHVAMTVGSSQPAGIRTAIWVCFGIALAGALIAAYVFALGRARLQRPELERWERGDAPALHSPPLAAGIRSGTSTAPRRPRPHRPRPREHGVEPRM